MTDLQRILNQNKIVVIADYREKDVISHLKNMDIVVNVTSLCTGDFICSEKGVAIERKTHSDFVSSIIDGRIFEQAKLLKENFEKPIIVVEGCSNRAISGSALSAALARLVVDFSVSVVNTKNVYDTARFVYWTAKKEQEEKNQRVAFKIGKKPKDVRRMQEMIVASLPGVSNIISKRLLSYFGSVEKVFEADEDQLTKVKGVGNKLALKIRKILEENYY